MDLVRRLGPNVRLDRMAGVMVKKAVEGGEEGNEIFENGDINRYDIG